MPLHKGSSEESFKENVREMIHAGHPQDQALAAAYRQKRESADQNCATCYEDEMEQSYQRSMKGQC